MNKLFSYGTLQLEKVQKETFGRLLKGSIDVLVGYKVSNLKIYDKSVIASSGTGVHPIVLYTGLVKDRVNGMLFEVSDEELAYADKYEVSDYTRVELYFESGEKGFVYIMDQ